MEFEGYAEDNNYEGYWACAEDTQVLARLCQEKVSMFWDRLRRHPKLTRALRSWAYYHGYYFEDGDYTFSALKSLDGADVAAAANHYRNVIQHVLTLVTQHRPATKGRARNSDTRSLEQAKMSDNVAEHYMREGKVENYLYRSVEHALVLSEGYIYVPWNWEIGEEVEAVEGDDDVEEVSIGGGMKVLVPTRFIRQGDIDASNPTLFDVVYDHGIRDWERRQWCQVRTWENKYDLAATLSENGDEEAADQVRNLSISSQSAHDDFIFGIGNHVYEEQSDLIPVWNVHHKDTSACPGGLLFRWVGDGIPISERVENPYQDGRSDPLFRVVPGESIFEVDGYTMAFDLQPIQELINSSTSTIATNLKATGYAAVAAPYGWEVDEERFDEGVFIVRGRQNAAPQMPTGLNLTPTQRHHQEFLTHLVQAMEYISGVNAVARGQAEANMRSGEALKVMDSKAVQFANALTNSYYKTIEQVMTFIVRTVRDMMDEEDTRRVSIIGEDYFTRLGEFTKEDLDGFDRIEVEAVSPLSKTISGRAAIAQELLQTGFIRTPEEYLTVIQTGQLKKALRADDAELSLIHDENDALRRGEKVPVDRLQDYHALHIREHKSLLDSVDAKNNPQLYAAVQSHNMAHIEALVSPDVQIAQQALGFPVPVPMLPTTPGALPPGSGGVPGGGMTAPAAGESNQPESQSGEKPQPAPTAAGA